MKVQNTAIFMGDNAQNERHGRVAEKKEGRKTIFAGNRNTPLDLVAQKKQRAQKKAMKVVGDAWDNDRKVEKTMEESRIRFEEYRGIVGEANEEIRRIEEERNELRERYEIAQDSQEEQDLSLLIKKVDSKRIGSGVSLTEEEKEKIAQIEEKGLTDYQERSLELYQSGDPYRINKWRAQLGMEAENAFIRGIKRELPKLQKGMINAQKSADDIMEAASEEIIGMLTEEAKDHIDEEMEEKKEAAEEKAEKEKEEEEKLEKIKAEKAEKEEFSEEVSEQAGEITKTVVEMEDTMNDVQKEVKKIIDEMKVLEEDLKGAAVNVLR